MTKRLREWRAKNLEHARAQGRKHAKASRLRRLDAVRKKQRERYALNPEKYRTVRKAYYWKNAELQREYARKWAREHREEQRANARKRYLADRDAAIVRNREWKAKHPEAIQIYKRRDYQRHKTAILRRNKEWEKKNPAKHKLIRQGVKGRRRARIKENGWEKFSLTEIVKRDGMRCHICEKPVAKKDLSFDHLIPISKGGGHTRANIAVAHLLCNIRRGDGRIPAQLRLIG